MIIETKQHENQNTTHGKNIERVYSIIFSLLIYRVVDSLNGKAESSKKGCEEEETNGQ